MNLCETLDRHGHQDWYLPAYEEGLWIAVNEALIDTGSAENLDFTTYDYWTSMEFYPVNAYRIINSGSTASTTKTDTQAVRCVRRGGVAEAGMTEIGTTGTLANLDRQEDIQVVGDYAYITNGFANRFTIIDVSDPANPTEAGSVGSIDYPFGLDVIGNYAYITVRDDDMLAIYDISNPASPSEVGNTGTLTNLDWAYDVDVVGNYAYVAAYARDALTIIDVSNPASPTEVGSTGPQSRLEGARKVEVIGNYAYVLSDVGVANRHFNVIDVSNPASPSEVGYVDLSPIQRNNRDLAVSGNYAYVTGTDEVSVIDISNPVSPTIVATTTQLRTDAYMSLVGDYAYVPFSFSSADGLSVYDISDPTNPSLAAFSLDESFQHVDNIDVDAGYIYITNPINDRLSVYKLSDVQFCSPTSFGAIEYNDSKAVFQGCTDNGWQALSSNNEGTKDGLVAWWKLDETAGLIAVDSIGINDGSMIGGLNATNDSVSAVVGQGLEFDGTDDYINVPNASTFMPSNDQTIAFWLRPNVDWNTEPNALWRIFGMRAGASDDDPGLRIIVNGFLGGDPMYFRIGDDAGDHFNSSFIPADWVAGTWYHLAHVFKQNAGTPSGEWFMNGASENSGTHGGPLTPAWGTEALRIGAGYFDDDLDGTLDDVRFYNRALSAYEISELYSHKSTLISDPCHPFNAPDPGQACDDGSVYAGLTPDGNDMMFTTQCNVGQTWTDPTCSGSSSIRTWNANFAHTDYQDTGASAYNSGFDNSYLIVTIDADGTETGFQTHRAASDCTDLTYAGHTDWYLPAPNELSVLYNNRVAIGNFESNDYWSSREAATASAGGLDFSDGSTIASITKNSSNYVRCTRKGYVSTACVNPAGTQGEIIYNTTENLYQGCTSYGWQALHK